MLLLQIQLSPSVFHVVSFVLVVIILSEVFNVFHLWLFLALLFKLELVVVDRFNIGTGVGAVESLFVLPTWEVVDVVVRAVLKAPEQLTLNGLLNTGGNFGFFLAALLALLLLARRGDNLLLRFFCELAHAYEVLFDLREALLVLVHKKLRPVLLQMRMWREH
jgi:hypothetical protein